MPSFDELKAIWPSGHRGSLTVAQKRWSALKEPEQAQAIQGAHRARESRSWRDGFVPHMATFLFQRRWEDLTEAPPENRELTPREYKAWMSYARRVGSWELYRCRHDPKCQTDETHRRKMVDWLMASGWD